MATTFRGTVSEAPVEAKPAAPRAEARTAFAARALDMVELFKLYCGGDRIVGSSSTFRLELDAPEGPSTGGGKQAVQHIKLVPNRGTTIVVGCANQITGTCELRTYDYLAEQHALRFKGQPLPFARDNYNDVLKKLQSFFGGRRMLLTTVDMTRAAAGSPAQVRGSYAWPAVVVAGMMLAALLAVLLRR